MFFRVVFVLYCLSKYGAFFSKPVCKTISLNYCRNVLLKPYQTPYVFQHVKMTCFRANAHLAFNWWLDVFFFFIFFK